MKEESTLKNRILNLFTTLSGGPVTQKHFEKEFADVPLTTILPVLNGLQKEGLLDVLVNADRTLSWQLRNQEEVETLKKLSDLEERLVYNAIRKAGNDAISVKSISIDTKLQQNRIPRILRSLLSKKLIKELPLSTGQKHKVYLLIDLEPSEKLAANTLFAGDSGVDAEFVAMLRAACLKYLQDKVHSAMHIADPLERRNATYVSVDEVHRFISNAKICTVTMTPQDVRCVLDALKFGGELESRITSDSNEVFMSTDEVPTSCIFYRIAPRTTNSAGLARAPCTICVCRRDCRSGGSVNPENCKLFQAFLDF